MKNNRVFLSEIFQFLEVNFSIYLNGRVFVMNDFIAPRYAREIEGVSGRGDYEIRTGRGKEAF